MHCNGKPTTHPKPKCNSFDPMQICWREYSVYFYFIKLYKNPLLVSNKYSNWKTLYEFHMRIVCTLNHHVDHLQGFKKAHACHSNFSLVFSSSFSRTRGFSSFSLRFTFEYFCCKQNCYSTFSLCCHRSQ